MPITPTYPGVYVEELPSGTRTITGVSTSVTAFVGYTPAGPTDEPRRVFNFGEYERTFGGLDGDSPLSYALSQFFRNGGGEAWIVRVANGATRASSTMRKDLVTAVLKIEALSGGKWGNNLQIDVDYDTSNPNGTFNIDVIEVIDTGGRSESFRNLSMNSNSPYFVESVVNAGSSLIRVTRLTATVTGDGTSSSGEAVTLADLAASDGGMITVIVDGKPPITVQAFDPSALPSGVTALDDVADGIETAINNASTAANNVSVSQAGGVFTITSGLAADQGSEIAVLSAATNDGARALKLGVANGGVEIPAAAELRPAQTGTVGDDDLTAAATTFNDKRMKITVVTDPGVGDETGDIIIPASTFDSNSTLGTVAAKVQELVRTIDPTKTLFSRATASIVGKRIRIVMGDSPNAIAKFTNTVGGQLATALKIDSSGGAPSENVARYALGVGRDTGSQTAVSKGSDGTKGGASELIGTEAAKTGIYALKDVDLFNILSIPETAALPDPQDQTVISTAAGFAATERAFYIVDPPDRVDSITGIEGWVSSLGLTSNYAAVYFPRVRFADPGENFRLGVFAPSGTLAGLYARTDASRGVWKAAAGTEASLSNVSSLAVPLTDDENGVLNKVGINCLRSFPVYGRVSWGARTMEGADQQASEWKYVPVRRTALYIEESLFRGLKWAVFEPNGDTLWAQIRVAAGGFMNNLFRQGAFKGTSPREAYFVKCDGETTTQNDIDLGIVNVLVGFAPLKPAEFVILKIQQIAGQVET